MDYQLEQTGEQVQEILNQAPTTEQNLQNEITRSTGKDEELETAISNEKNRAEGVEAELQTAIGNENARAEGVEAELQTAIANEKNRAEGVEGGLRTDVDGIEAKIPAGASEQNKLATESFVNSSVATNTADFKGTFPSLEALQTEVHDADANDYAFVISTDAAGNTVYNRYKYVTGTGWVFEYALNNSSFTAAQWAAIQSGITALLVAKLAGLPTVAELTQQLNTIIASVSDEQTRAEGAEAVLRQSIADNATAIANEKTRAQNAEGTLSTTIVNEENRAKAAEVVLQQNIDAEAILRDNADDALQAQIDDIDAKIPEQASASNQLADKSFVNSSIATNTADFKGTYNSLQELQQVSANNNDYGFVVSVDSYGNTVYNRYKYVDGTGWVFEYALNNSSFTSAQWAAIQSGITAALVAKLNGLPDITALNAMFAAITNLIPSAATSENKLVDYAQMVAALATKQNTLTFDNVPTEDSNNPVKSGGVYTAIATVTAAIAGLESSKQDKLTFDAYPTAGSDNPVKSKGIYEKLAEKQATLVPGTNLDTTPTANSNNPVTSGGVKAALDLKQNTLTFDNAPTVNSNNPVKSGGIKSAIDSEATRAQGVENSLGVRVSTNETDIANLQQLYNNLQQSKPVPVTALPSSGQQQGVIYRLAGTTSYSDYMWNGSSWVLMATYNNAIDNYPTINSLNIVSSDGVGKAIYKSGNFSKIDVAFVVGVIRNNGQADLGPQFLTNRISDYFSVNKGERIRLKTQQAVDPYAVIVYFNPDYTFYDSIPSKYITTGENEFISPVDGYARVYTTTDINPSLDVYVNDSGSIINENANKEYIDGYFYTGLLYQGCLHTDGEAYIMHISYRTTDYIHLNAGEGVEFMPPTLSGIYCVLCIYDTVKTLVSAKNYTAKITRYIATEECFIRVSVDVGLGYYIKLINNSTYSISKWAGKKIGFVGDSTTAMSTYPSIYASLSGCTAINYGVSGTTIADAGGANPMCLRVSSLAADLDMVCVLGGVNDNRGGVPLGEFEDYNLDGLLNNTFYGALHTLARALKEKFPTKPIVFMTPMHNNYKDDEYGDTGEYNYNQLQLGKLVENKFPLDANGDIDDTTATGGTLSQYIQAIKEVCAFYAIPVIDLHSICGIQPILSDNKTIYMPDGIHPTTVAGSERIAETIYPFLEEMYQ